ncbi:MAG: hypothetical protein JO152_07065 [Mycobacteriaceae bacterium]|nr:hypothetical protein [Mycobacteriaceae bacterium]
MAMNSASIYKSIEPVVRHFWGVELDDSKNPAVYDKIADVEETDEPVMEATEYGGPGTMTYKPENERITFDAIIQGGTKRWSAGTWATGIEISLEAAEDTKYRAIRTAASSLGRAAKLTPEYLFAQFLDRAFNTSYPATNDALPICSASHTVPKGGTYSNLLSTAYSLGELPVEQVFQNLATLPGPDGMITPLMPTMLVVPPALGPLSWKLMNTQLQVGSAQNDRSFIAGKLDVTVNPYLGSNTRYFFKTNAQDGLFWKWRVKPQFMRDNVDAVTMALYMSRFRAYWGIVDGRGIYGVNAS